MTPTTDALAAELLASDAGAALREALADLRAGDASLLVLSTEPEDGPGAWGRVLAAEAPSPAHARLVDLRPLPLDGPPARTAPWLEAVGGGEAPEGEAWSPRWHGPALAMSDRPLLPSASPLEAAEFALAALPADGWLVVVGSERLSPVWARWLEARLAAGRHRAVLVAQPAACPGYDAVPAATVTPLPALRGALDRLGDRARRVPAPELARPRVAALVAEALGGEAPAKAAAHAMMVTSGQAGLVAELLARLASHDGLANVEGRAGGLPAQLLAHHAQRGWADDVPEGTTPDTWLPQVARFLAVGALVGDVFPWDLIALGQGADEALSDAIADFVDDHMAEDDGLVEDLGAKGHPFEGHIAYRFKSLLGRRAALVGTLTADDGARARQGLIGLLFGRHSEAPAAVSRAVARQFRHLGQPELCGRWWAAAEAEGDPVADAGWARALASSAADAGTVPTPTVAEWDRRLETLEARAYVWTDDRRLALATVLVEAARRLGDEVRQARAAVALSRVRGESGDVDGARAAAETAAGLAPPDGDAPRADRVAVQLVLAEAAYLRGDGAAATQAYDAARGLWDAPPSAEAARESHVAFARTWSAGARLALAAGQFDGAGQAAGQAVQAWQATLDLVAERDEQGWSLRNPTPEAHEAVRHGLAEAALAQKDGAIAALAQGRAEEAATALGHASQAFGGCAGPRHRAHYGMHLFHARALVASGQLEPAEELYELALHYGEELPTPFARVVVECWIEAGSLFLERERHADALVLLDRAVATLSGEGLARYPGADPRPVVARAERARALGLVGRGQEAAAALVEADTMARERLPEGHPLRTQVSEWLERMRAATAEA